MNLRAVLFVGLYLLLDVYVYLGTKNLFQNSSLNLGYKAFFIASALFSYYGLFVMFGFFRERPTSVSFFYNFAIGYSFAFFVFKLLFSAVFLVEDIARILIWAGEGFKTLFATEAETVNFLDRRDFVKKIGLILAGLPFLSLFFGITKGKYWYNKKKVSLNFSNLPLAFDGLKIVHISDIHSGSFDSKEDVARGVQMIQDSNPDLILFTGDLVTNTAEEIEPYMDLFKNLYAPLGKFSSLGNHDYGDYVSWESPEAKVANLDRLKSHHVQMGFDLLNNSNRKLEKGGSHIYITGVENWGRKPFPQFGDLDKALNGVEESDFKVLLSHDPTHWDMQVKDHPTPVELTLSGHTHGMQFGIEIPGWKWSPVKYVYKKWAGLYQEKNQNLYVNRGFGFLGFPGRVGMWPEITEITLQTTKA